MAIYAHATNQNPFALADIRTNLRARSDSAPAFRPDPNVNENFGARRNTSAEQHNLPVLDWLCDVLCVMCAGHFLHTALPQQRWSHRQWHGNE